MTTVTVKVFNEFPPLPTYATEGAAAMDVYASKNVYISPGKRGLIPTGLYVEIPEGFKINVLPRSGLANKQGVTVLNSPGLIDHDYRGSLGVILVNHGSDPIDVKVGDRIAQIEIAPVYYIAWSSVETKEELSKTVRGEGGFGSTGSK